MSKKKGNFWYWLGQTALGLATIGVAFSAEILDLSFPEHTAVNKLAIPIGLGAKYLWDRVLYQRGTMPSSKTEAVMDMLPDKLTGIKDSKRKEIIKNNLPSGLSDESRK